jgi:outer membrane receptor protein involved in Fe transport
MLYKNDTTGRGQNSEVVSIIGYSFKGGLNYNINEQHNFYMNAGKFSRAPFFSFVFVNNSNDVVQNLVNEKAESFELGYGFRTDKVAIKLNAYYTNWKDKSLLSGNITGPNGSVTRALMTGANALHKGIELEFNTKPIKNLEIGGIVSLGDWRWKGDINATVYSEIDPNISSTVTSFVDGVHVGDAPQNQYGLQGRYQITKGLYAGFTFVYNDKFYSNFDPSKKTDVEDKVDSYKIPSYYNLDARIGYDIQLKNYKIQLAIQGFNLTDVRFLSDATDLDGTTFAYAFPGFGRNFNFSAKISF